MIKQFNRIKNFGIFSDYKGSDSIVFNKYNVFYGWNGSGKSTLSKIFRVIETRKLPNDFSEAEFSIEMQDGSILNQTFSITPPNVRVFNSQFILDNLFLESGQTGSIIYIGTGGGELKKELDSIKIYQTNLTEKCNQERAKLDEFNKLRDTFFIESGSQLRSFFLTTIFANHTFDKRSSLQIWEEIKSHGESLNDFKLDDFHFRGKQQFIAQGQRKEKVVLELKKLDSTLDEDLFKDVRILIQYNPVINTIERLQKNTDISKWVQSGLLLHEKHNSLNCEFCGQSMPDGRLNELQKHFNEEFINLQNKIKSKQVEIRALSIPKLELDKSAFFTELIPRIEEKMFEYEEVRLKINEGLAVYQDSLQSKRENPLRHDIGYQSIGTGMINTYNYIIDDISRIIKVNNENVENYNQESLKCKQDLEKHFVASKAIESGLIKLNGEIKILSNKEIETQSELKFLEARIEAIEIQLQNDVMALNQVNKELHKFLGRIDIVLEKNVTGGYLLKRDHKVALHLSEGEKTAIALIFFIAKLKERDNDIKSTVIVFDDPISSFDSNHLFNAFSYIVNNTREAEQLFILTHNFWFFKLIRDWMKKQNRKAKEKERLNIANFFELKRGNILPANRSLIDYHSEYHYVFKKLFEYRNKAELTLDDSFALANSARRVLESFSAFKQPSDSGFEGVLRMAKAKKIDSTTTDKIFYFLNKYSHLDRIETHENTIENIEQEGGVIANDILNIIRVLDPEHYSSMESISSS